MSALAAACPGAGVALSPMCELALVRNLQIADVSPSAKVVGCYLISRYNPDEGGAWPSFETIAADCRMSLASAKRAVAELEATGWFVVTRRRRPGRKESLSNHYMPNLDRAADPWRGGARPSQGRPEVVSAVTPRSVRNDPVTLPIESTQRIKKPIPIGAPPVDNPEAAEPQREASGPAVHGIVGFFQNDRPFPLERWRKFTQGQRRLVKRLEGMSWTSDQIRALSESELGRLEHLQTRATPQEFFAAAKAMREGTTEQTRLVNRDDIAAFCEQRPAIKATEEEKIAAQGRWIEEEKRKRQDEGYGACITGGRPAEVFNYGYGRPSEPVPAECYPEHLREGRR